MTHGTAPISAATAALTPTVAAPAAQRPEAAPTTTCTNCGAEGCENFCPRCGQETHGLHRSLVGIAGELLDALLGWDGKIPTTLWLMVRHPGALTRDFLEGRRMRHLRPLRLYLTLSVLFFLSLSLVTKPPKPGDTGGVTYNSGPAISFGRDRTALTNQDGTIRTDKDFDAFIARHRNERGRDPLTWFRRNFTGGLAALKAQPKERQAKIIKDGLYAKAPNMVFLLLPVFALLLRILYLRTPVYYAEHFVFALHNHAFAYLAMTLAHLASVWLMPIKAQSFSVLFVLWMPIYFFVSMRRVYGGSRLRTFVKFTALSVVYGVILFAATAITVLATIVSFA